MNYLNCVVCESIGIVKCSSPNPNHYYCEMCGSFMTKEPLSPNISRLVLIHKPKYYDYFMKLQEIVNSEDSTIEITKACIKAIGLQSSKNVI